MKNYTRPQLTILGAVADETLASTVSPLLKCAGSGDALMQLTVQNGTTVCSK